MFRAPPVNFTFSILIRKVSLPIPCYVQWQPTVKDKKPWASTSFSRQETTLHFSPQEIVWQFFTFTGFPFDFAQDREPVERQMMPCWWIRVSQADFPFSFPVVIKVDCRLQI